VLRLSIDEREDEDVEGEAASLPFVVDADIAERYGRDFSVAMDERRIPAVTATRS
jgi:hypothetical protein